MNIAQAQPAHVKQWVLGQALILIVSPPVLLHYSYLHPALALPGSRDLHSFAILSTLLSSPPPGTGTGTHLTSVPPPPPPRDTELAVDRAQYGRCRGGLGDHQRAAGVPAHRGGARQEEGHLDRDERQRQQVIRLIYVHIYTAIYRYV